MSETPARNLLPMVRQSLTELWQAALDFIYPPGCLLCGVDFTLLATGPFCPGCASGLAPAIEHACQRCGAPVGPFLNTSLGCIHCRTTPFHFEKLLRLGVYREDMMHACRRIKQSGQEPLTEALGELLWTREREAFEQARIDCVISVPRHWTGRLLHHHNPSETLARFFADKLNRPYAGHKVRKTRYTPKQSRLPPSQRKTNLREAFRLRHPHTLAGQRVLLVDDVLTTGTTINRIGRVLKKAGVSTITVAVLARGLGDAR